MTKVKEIRDGIAAANNVPKTTSSTNKAIGSAAISASSISPATPKFPRAI